MSYSFAYTSLEMEGGLDVKTQITIIISTYMRVHLLNWGLFSLAKQAIPFQYETIVINDGIRDETEEICKGTEKQSGGSRALRSILLPKNQMVRF